jgi:hypothetical protein
MSDFEESDDNKPDLENTLPRGAYDAMQNDNPGANDIADALEKFGHIEIVREWVVEILRAKRPRHRPKSYRIRQRNIENGLQALETGRGFLHVDERTERRHKVDAQKYLKFGDQLVEEVRKLAEADKKS